MSEPTRNPDGTVNALICGLPVVLSLWYYQWVSYMATAEKRTVDVAYFQLRSGLITKADSPVFSDYWKDKV